MTAFAVRSTLAAGSLALLLTLSVRAQTPPSATATALPLFAVEITTGAQWDQTKPPQDQPFFREHSANLKRLRDAGALIMGARYSDKGLVILAAKDETSARAMMDEDPSIKARVFAYALHRFDVFYGGTVDRPQRPPQ